MKLFRLFTALIFLTAGLAVVSCDKSDPEPAPSIWAGIVRVNDDNSFTDGTGARLIASNPMLIDDDIAFICCRIDSPLATGTAYNVTLLEAPQGTSGSSFSLSNPGIASDPIPNAAICTMKAESGDYSFSPALFDANMVVMPVTFFVQDVTSDEQMKAELNKHVFGLVYYLDTTEAGDTELTLYLRHVVADPATVRSKKITIYKTFSITNILENFRRESEGNTPSKIVIGAEENRNSDTLGGAAEKKYELIYNFD